MPKGLLTVLVLALIAVFYITTNQREYKETSNVPKTSEVVTHTTTCIDGVVYLFNVSNQVRNVHGLAYMSVKFNKNSKVETC